MRPPSFRASARGHRSQRLRLRSLILLVVLVPILGMVAMSAMVVGVALNTQATARQVEARATSLAALAEARGALASELATSTLLVFAAELGLDDDALRWLTGTDHRSELQMHRTDVDADARLHSFAELADQRPHLDDVREAVDEGTASTSRIRSVYDDLIALIDRAWEDEFDEFQGDLRSGELSFSLQDRATALRSTFAAQRWGYERASLGIDLFQAERADPATEIRRVEAAGRYRAALESFEKVLGPAASEVWDAHLSNPAVQEYERVLADVEANLVIDIPSLTSTAVQDRFASADVWAAGLVDLVRAAAQDLSAEAARQRQDAVSSMQRRIAATGALSLFAIVGAVLLTRSVTRPISRLEAAANQIRAGDFALAPVAPSGPQELADTASAFNEMSATLASVETYATTLADEPEEPMLDDPIPGRTGQALQVALNRLRSSIREAEERRRELEVAATHDSLTGLFNRSAALMMIERDLAAAKRSDGAVMVLFIDLDEFKPINDRYGHAAGDDALRLVADALRETTRQADLVARIGGDEFLVAGAVADDAHEVERLAERIGDRIRTSQLGTPDGPIGLHCSIGMALSLPGDDVDLVVQRADSAMYDAKRQGRDRIVWSRAEGSTTPQS